MPKTLLQILTDLKKEPKGDLTAARDALEALLALDKSKLPDEQKMELDTILKAHKRFWDTQTLEHDSAAIVPDKLKQEVAEVLVMQGLQNANDQTLLDIFSKQNETQLIQYLNDKIANGKFVKMVDTKPQLDTDLISKETEAAIKGRAAELLLLRLLEIGSNSAQGQKHLKAFIDSTEPTATRLENFLAPFRIDEANKKNILASLGDEQENIFSRLLKKSQEEFIKQAYPVFLSGAKLGEIVPLPTILQDNEKFKEHLLKALELKIGTPISLEQVNDAKALLGLKYLQDKLLEENLDGDDLLDLLIVLNSTAKEELSSFIQEQLYDDKDEVRDAYIGLAVNKDGALLKTAIMKNHINTVPLVQYEDLTALVNTSDPVAFKKALEKLGITPPAEWIKGREQKEIVDSVKLRIQELKNIQLPLVQTSLAKEIDPQKLRKIIEAKDLVALKAVINDPAFAHGHWVEDA